MPKKPVSKTSQNGNILMRAKKIKLFTVPKFFLNPKGGVLTAEQIRLFNGASKKIQEKRPLTPNELSIFEAVMDLSKRYHEH